MVTRRDYTAEAVEAAKSVLIELTHLLGEYRDNIVLIGGWVPELLIPQKPRPHVGSIDIDLALNHLKIKYFTVPMDISGTAIMNLFRTVVASRPAFTISVADRSAFAFLTETK